MKHTTLSRNLFSHARERRLLWNLEIAPPPDGNSIEGAQPRVDRLQKALADPSAAKSARERLQGMLSAEEIFKQLRPYGTFEDICANPRLVLVNANVPQNLAEEFLRLLLSTNSIERGTLQTLAEDQNPLVARRALRALQQYTFVPGPFDDETLTYQTVLTTITSLGQLAGSNEALMLQFRSVVFLQQSASHLFQTYQYLTEHAEEGGREKRMCEEIARIRKAIHDYAELLPGGARSNGEASINGGVALDPAIVKSVINAVQRSLRDIDHTYAQVMRH